MSWVTDNLENALETWNDKLVEIWQLITQSPTEFKGGGIWDVIVNIHDGVKAIGLGLLVLFFVVGIWAVANDGAVSDCAGAYVEHHGGSGYRRRESDGFAGQYTNRD
jgi:hypothetical protein